MNETETKKLLTVDESSEMEALLLSWINPSQGPSEGRFPAIFSETDLIRLLSANRIAHEQREVIRKLVNQSKVLMQLCGKDLPGLVEALSEAAPYLD